MRWMEFRYDNRGFGDLILLDDEHKLDRYLCRTGSISKQYKLVNPIDPGEWYLCDESVDTEEKGMSVKGDIGWKIRLWKIDENGQLVFTHYLIHPDGGLPGSKGCIVIQGTNAISFRCELDESVQKQGKVPVKVGLRDGVIL